MQALINLGARKLLVKEMELKPRNIAGDHDESTVAISQAMS